MFANLPEWLRKFLIDFIETGLAAVLALSFVVPVTMEASKTVALMFAAAVAGAFVAAVRRIVPTFVEWVKGIFGVTVR